VDDLLNLVGELVISKASFFQVNDKISFVLDEFINQLSSYKKDVKMLNAMFISDESDLNTEENRQLIKHKIESLYSSLDKLTPTFKKTEDLLRSSTQSFGRLTNDLHESVMKLRMVPINQIFNRFPRLVRDLSKTLNKDIDLITRGEETELDKSLIEDLIDPLIHIVRNAVDHGIEPPEERTKKGKPRTGKLILEAEHEGQMISIRIKDDGKGLSREKIRKKAIEKGLIDPKIEYSDTDINNIIFQPGFSTTDSISQVSGRGVGMDVVKQKVDSLNGTISIETIQDKGTTFTIKLPLTLAIIQALMVQVADLTYSIPINSVIETIRISPEEIELLENHEIIRVRDEVNSLIHLKEVFNHGTRTQADYYYVIIVGSEESKIGLVVDGLIGEQDVVIKPLNSKFATSEGIAGATILGDGRVSLIIDIPQLIKIIVNNRH
jgi:two-component system chemotaxis sensor kinase CheA